MFDTEKMKRSYQLILIITFVAFSWLAMQAVHELGHVVGAKLTKAEVTKVVLHPCMFSRTDMGHNPHPLIVVWAGPVIGSMFPLLAFLVARVCRSPGIYLFRFFAGFCLIANGVYIAFGPADGAIDTGVMRLNGSPRWIMIAYGILTVPLGLCFWHRQGEYFGLGKCNGMVSRNAAFVSALLLVAIAGAEFILCGK